MVVKLRISKIIVAYIFTIVFVMGIIFFVQYNTKNIQDLPKISSINIKEVIENVKKENENLELIYETKNIEDIISLSYKIDNGYKNIIIDAYTGKEKTFFDLIKKNKKSEFYKKEEELLNLKYPEFIVEGIKNTDGNKYYLLKDNELTILYKGYTYDPACDFDISLKINYNEIKDYINFKPSFDSTYENEDGYNYDSIKKTIAFTFDDGPSRYYNARILDILSKNKAHATFFMVGSMMLGNENVVLNTFKSGNEIGSHTYEHMNISTNDINKVNMSLLKTNELYKSITKEDIKYIRPPYGAYNKNNLNNAQNPFILWDMDTEDWKYRNKEHIVNYIKENVHDGGIVLMHELYKTTADALEEILPWLYKEGYQVVSISELAKLKGKNLEAGHAYSSLK